MQFSKFMHGFQFIAVKTWWKIENGTHSSVRHLFGLLVQSSLIRIKLWPVSLSFTIKMLGSCPTKKKKRMEKNKWTNTQRDPKKWNPLSVWLWRWRGKMKASWKTYAVNWIMLNRFSTLITPRPQCRMQTFWRSCFPRLKQRGLWQSKLGYLSSAASTISRPNIYFKPTQQRKD